MSEDPNKINDGGPAFPVPAEAVVTEQGVQSSHGWGLGPQAGMTLRDYLAAQMLVGIGARTGMPYPDAMHLAAFTAFQMADAMIAMRSKSTGPDLGGEFVVIRRPELQRRELEARDSECRAIRQKWCALYGGDWKETCHAFGDWLERRTNGARS